MRNLDAGAPSRLTTAVPSILNMTPPRAARAPTSPSTAEAIHPSASVRTDQLPSDLQGRQTLQPLLIVAQQAGPGVVRFLKLLGRGVRVRRQRPCRLLAVARRNKGILRVHVMGLAAMPRRRAAMYVSIACRSAVVSAVARPAAISLSSDLMRSSVDLSANAGRSSGESRWYQARAARLTAGTKIGMAAQKASWFARVDRVPTAGGEQSVDIGGQRLG